MARIQFMSSGEWEVNILVITPRSTLTQSGIISLDFIYLSDRPVWKLLVWNMIALSYLTASKQTIIGK